MKMTRRNFISASAAAALACGASLTAHAAGSTDENSLNFITDIFKDSTQPGEIEEATAITAEKNAEWYETLDFSDRREFANAERGWLDNAEGRIIDGDDNRSAWDLQSYGDLNRDAPDTVNPSLWRNTQLNAKAGLFEVCDGIYQVRGFDMANTTFIRTDHGWIVFDVLMCRENMKAAKELMENRFGPLEIKAVLYSHSHVDHFGGVEGIIDRAQAADASLSLQDQLASGKIPVLAPAGFLKHAMRPILPTVCVSVFLLVRQIGRIFCPVTAQATAASSLSRWMRNWPKCTFWTTRKIPVPISTSFGRKP